MPAELSVAEARALGLIGPGVKAGPRVTRRRPSHVLSPPYSWSCAAPDCGQIFDTWAAVERHGDETGHLSVRCRDEAIAAPAPTQEPLR